jgi:hypothetical protein
MHMKDNEKSSFSCTDKSESIYTQTAARLVPLFHSSSLLRFKTALCSSLTTNIIHPTHFLFDEKITFISSSFY